MLNTEFTKTIADKIVEVLTSSDVSAEEKAVLYLLHKNWGVERLKQKAIVQDEKWAECRTPSDLTDTQTRKIRRIIRRLRVDHRIPILHDREGHFLPTTLAEAELFIERLERETKNHSKSSLETYRLLREELNVESSVLEKLEELLNS